VIKYWFRLKYWFPFLMPQDPHFSPAIGERR